MDKLITWKKKFENLAREDNTGCGWKSLKFQKFGVLIRFAYKYKVVE
jgi:hypothetical protein